MGARSADGPLPAPGHAAEPAGAASPRISQWAPLAFGLVLLHPLAALYLSIWAVDGILHCDDPQVDCGLGFAVHLVFPFLVGVMMAVVALVLGILVRPRTRFRARSWLLLTTTPTWLVLWWALASTVR